MAKIENDKMATGCVPDTQPVAYGKAVLKPSSQGGRGALDKENLIFTKNKLETK